QDFRAPSIAELFTANVTGTASVTDPCSDYAATGGNVAANCQQAGVPSGYTQVNTDVPSTSGRNPGLQPETSTSRTLGGTFVPWQSLPLKLDLDYFKIEVNDAIGSLNPQDIVNGCYVSGRSDLCGLVTRNASGAIRNLQNGNANLGSLLTEGIDAGAHYTWSTAAHGDFDFDWQTTWVKRFTQTQPNLADPSAPIVTELVDTETGRPAAGYPKFKSELDASWQYRSWDLRWRVHYVSNLGEACSDKYDGTALSFTNLGLCAYPDDQNNALSRNKLGSSTWHDVQADYQFDQGRTILTFGILNVFDKQPPIGHSMSDSFDVTVYPIPGRFPYVSISHTF
ncbi:MAG: TonB-dependent receptor domain-containing protein, partial [Gammaproteobacteria bacterium]